MDHQERPMVQRAAVVAHAVAVSAMMCAQPRDSLSSSTQSLNPTAPKCASSELARNEECAEQ